MIRADGCAASGAPAEDNPDPVLMFLRFAALVSGVGAAGLGMVRERRFRHLATWLGGWALFLTWPRYLICSRCEGYGRMCRSHYLGEYTSFLFPRVEGKGVGSLGLALEVLSLSIIFWVPVLGLRKDARALAGYLASMQAVLLGQFLHACRWCAAHSGEEWKSMCPVYRFWSKRA